MKSQRGKRRMNRALAAMAVTGTLVMGGWNPGALATDTDTGEQLTRAREQLAVAGERLQAGGEPTAARFRAKEEHDRLSAEVTLLELAWTESVFGGATPGSPDQFRGRESADAL